MRSFPAGPRLWWAGCLAMVCAGCATPPRQGALQTLELEVVTPLGAPVAAASCSLSHAGGEWTATAPGRVTLTTGTGPLRVSCRSDGGASGETSVAAGLRGGRLQGALAGGGVGVLAGALLGNVTTRSKPRDFVEGKQLATIGGGLVGGLIGITVGATSAEPRYEYPAKVRVVLQPPPG